MGFTIQLKTTDSVDNFNCWFVNDIYKTFKSLDYEIILKERDQRNILKQKGI